MNGSNVKRSQEDAASSNAKDGAYIFNDEDYKELVETTNNSSSVLRPASPYQIPEQAKMEHMTFASGERVKAR